MQCISTLSCYFVLFLRELTQPFKSFVIDDNFLTSDIKTELVLCIYFSLHQILHTYCHLMLQQECGFTPTVITYGCLINLYTKVAAIICIIQLFVLLRSNTYICAHFHKPTLRDIQYILVGRSFFFFFFFLNPIGLVSGHSTFPN